MEKTLMANYHLTESGPKKCRAFIRSCPYSDHFSTLERANEVFEENLAKTYSTFQVWSRDKQHRDSNGIDDDSLTFREPKNVKDIENWSPEEILNYAKNTDASSKGLSILLRSPIVGRNREVLYAIAENPNLSENTIDGLSLEDPYAPHLLKNPNITSKAIGNIYSSRPGVYEYLLSDSRMPPEILDFVSSINNNSEDYTSKLMAVAENEANSTMNLNRIYQNHRKNIRIMASVAGNPKTHPETLTAIAEKVVWEGNEDWEKTVVNFKNFETYRDDLVRNLLSNPSLSAYSLKRLQGSDNPLVQKVLSEFGFLSKIS